jgi:hypothetical protein
LRDDFDDDLIEGFASDDPVEGISAFSQSMLVAITQLEALPIVIDILSKATDVVNTMHPERCFIRP